MFNLHLDRHKMQLKDTFQTLIDFTNFISRMVMLKFSKEPA